MVLICSRPWSASFRGWHWVKVDFLLICIEDPVFIKLHDCLIYENHELNDIDIFRSCWKAYNTHHDKRLFANPRQHRPPLQLYGGCSDDGGEINHVQVGKPTVEIKYQTDYRSARTLNKRNPNYSHRAHYHQIRISFKKSSCMRCLISGSEQPPYQAGDRWWKLSAQLPINHHHHHKNIAKSKTKIWVPSPKKQPKHLQQGIHEPIPNNSSRSSNCGKAVWLSISKSASVFTSFE